MFFRPNQRPGRNHYFRLSPAEVEALQARQARRLASSRARIAADIEAAKQKVAGGARSTVPQTSSLASTQN